MKGLGAKLKRLAAARDLTDAEVARASGLEPRTYGHYTTDTRKPDLETFARICRALGTTPNDVLGLHPDGDDFALVPVYDVRVAAGAGAFNPEENVKYLISFRHDWLRTITTAPIDKLAVVEADGDSMAPTINDRDHLLVDLSQTRPGRDGIYFVSLDDASFVKRVTVDPVRRMVTLSSDNPMYQPLSPVPAADLRVVGRVLWIGRRV